MKRVTRTPLLKALCMAVPTLGFMLSLPGLVDAYLLSRGGVNALGTVSDAACGNHRTYTFKFEVDGKTYFGSGGRPCETVRLDDSVSIWYLPTDPSKNTGAEPAAQFRGSVVSTALVLAIFSGVAVAVWRRAAA
jgi:hypothetical protein